MACLIQQEAPTAGEDAGEIDSSVKPVDCIPAWDIIPYFPQCPEIILTIAIKVTNPLLLNQIPLL